MYLSRMHLYLAPSLLLKSLSRLNSFDRTLAIRIIEACNNSHSKGFSYFIEALIRDSKVMRAKL